jgi:hypothetical protein
MASQGYNSLDTTTAYYDSVTPATTWSSAVRVMDGVPAAALALSGFCAVAQRAGVQLAQPAVAAWWDMLALNAFMHFAGVTLELAMATSTPVAI